METIGEVYQFINIPKNGIRLTAYHCISKSSIKATEEVLHFHKLGQRDDPVPIKMINYIRVNFVLGTTTALVSANVIHCHILPQHLGLLLHSPLHCFFLDLGCKQSHQSIPILHKQESKSLREILGAKK